MQSHAGVCACRAAHHCASACNSAKMRRLRSSTASPTAVGSIPDGRRSNSFSPSVSSSSRTERVTADCARKSSAAARLALPCSTTIVNTRSWATLRSSAGGDVELTKRADVRRNRRVRQQCRRAAIFWIRALRSPGLPVVTACACCWSQLRDG
jgi:hypothetical protein